MNTTTINEYLNHVPTSKDKLASIGYFAAPASKSHHLSVAGGLAEHSANVTAWLLRLTESMEIDWPRPESPYIIGMLHDLVKCKCYELAPDSRTFDGTRYEYRHPEYPGHGAASIIIAVAELGVTLLPVEAVAIAHHMGAFCLTGDALKVFDAALDKYPREIIATHTADMLASRVDEAKQDVKEGAK